MSLSRGKEIKQSPTALEWPRHLSTPGEVLKALRHRTHLNLIRSPNYSKLVLQFVGSWAYLLAHGLNTTRVQNYDTFRNELSRVEQQQASNRERTDCSTLARQCGPLLTYSNHISCIDDPVLWASLLPLTYYTTHTESVRWSAAAVEICFSKPWHSTFFSLGKTFPIIRGHGVSQPAMDFARALMENNQWLHLFPEGRVMRDHQQQKISNKDRGYIFKWGISKLIMDYFRPMPIRRHDRDDKQVLRILPFYHLGMDDILPIGWPYIPRVGKQISIFIRPTVIEMNSQLLAEILAERELDDSLQTKQLSSVEIDRIKLTNFLEEELELLVEPANELHKQGC